MLCMFIMIIVQYSGYLTHVDTAPVGGGGAVLMGGGAPLRANRVPSACDPREPPSRRRHTPPSLARRARRRRPAFTGVTDFA